MTWHKDATPPDVHIPYSWIYANQTARESATGLVAADVGKFSRQTDDNTIWMLTNHSPVTWLFIGGGSGTVGTFIGLSDVPSSYSGEGSRVVAVKATEDGLEFSTITISEIQDHIDSTAIHFFEYDIDHRNIQYIGTYTHTEIDSHINDGTIHFTESSIDHTNIQNIGTNTHAQIDSHISDSSIHFTEASIDHENIQNIGVNTHAEIDAHIADTTSNPHMVTYVEVGAAPLVHTHVEADITDLDHDAQKIKGVPVDDSNIADGRVLKYNVGSGNLEYEDESGGGGISEIESWSNTSEVESSTTSTTFQEKLQLSVSIDTTGTFMLEWYAEARQQSVGDAVECRVQQDDTDTHALCRFYSGDSGGTNWLSDFQPFAGHIILGLDAGSYDFDLDYRSTSSGNTTEIRRARLTLWRMS